MPANQVHSDQSYLNQMTSHAKNKGITDATGRATIAVSTSIYQGVFDTRKPLGDRLSNRTFLFRVGEDVFEVPLRVGREVCGETYCVTVEQIGKAMWQEEKSEEVVADSRVTEEEKEKILQVARREVAAREDWADRAHYEVWRRPVGLDRWWVTVRRALKYRKDGRPVFAGENVDVIVRIDEHGGVIEYRDK